MTNKKHMEPDIVVAGGGMAGCAAALAAARKNMRVTLIEKSFYLGGTATKVQFAEMNGVKKNGRDIYAGIAREIMDLLVGCGAEYNLQVPMSSDPGIKIDRLRYNPETMKLIWEQLLTDAGVKILYNAPFRTIAEHRDTVSLSIVDQYNEIVLDAKILVDCTGNADAAHMIGYETRKSRGDDIQSATSVFWMTNADMGRLGAFISGGGLAPVMREGYERGILKGRILALTPIPGTTNVAVNATRAEHVDHESITDLTEGIIETRRQIVQLLPYLKQKVDGLENAVLSFVSPELGVRDSRRIRGKYTLTGRDLIDKRDFPDAVAVGGYPIDIHDARTKGVVWTDIEGVYRIPYSCMLPERPGRTLVSGKAVSADKEAFGAIRVIPTVVNMGEAAGHAAYLAVRDGVCPDRIDVGELKNLQNIL